MVVGVSGVVVTCYSYVIPSLADSHPVVAVFWVVYGHYLLVNIVFHYYKGFLLGPGQPTKVRRMQDAQWGWGGSLSTCPGAVIVPNDQVMLVWNHDYMVG